MRPIIKFPFEGIKYWWIGLAEDLYEERIIKLHELDSLLDDLEDSNDELKEVKERLYTLKQYRIRHIYAGKIFQRYLMSFFGLLGLGGLLGLIAFIRSFM